ncbi:MAG: putative cupredoxin-like copper-binding protein [Pseudorhodobacter sp.]|jgi:uncharacterized cupredoxin-like copper-binding protein
MKLMMIAALLALTAAPAHAAGTHEGGHGEMMEVGKHAKKTGGMTKIKISLTETDDGEMLFAPRQLTFKAGETVIFTITNDGEAEHEFVMDTFENNAKHKELMARFPEMEHDDPNAVRLQPGEKGTIVWTFANAGQFEFACLIPGHYEAGMHGTLAVN